MSPLGYRSPSITLYVLWYREDRAENCIHVVLRIVSGTRVGYDCGADYYLVWILSDEDLSVDCVGERVVGSRAESARVLGTEIRGAREESDSSESVVGVEGVRLNAGLEPS